jgi:hypothetical protein
MTIIVLPDDMVPNDATPFLRDFGGVLTPFLGGEEQRINRVGNRFGLRVTIPPKLYRDRGMVLVSRLLQARQDRLRMRWPLLGFNPGATGSPAIAATVTGGMAIPLKGLPAGYPIREGQFFSIIHNGRRYVHMFTADVAASGGGTVTASIFPMLRKGLSVDDVVELLLPMIEGFVLPGEELSWRMSVDKMVDVSFSVVEAG